MPENSTFKIYSDQPVRYSSVTSLNSMFDPVYYYNTTDLNYATQVSGQFDAVSGPKRPNDILCTFDADDANLPSSSAAALVSVNDYDFLAFDAASTETAYFDGVMPENYQGSDVQARLAWTNETGTGNVMWQISLARLTGDNNLYSTTYLAAVSGTDAAPTTSGSPQELYLQMSAANLGNIAKVEDYRLRVSRIGGNALDTMTGDAYLLNVSLEELI